MKLFEFVRVGNKLKMIFHDDLKLHCRQCKNKLKIDQVEIDFPKENNLALAHDIKVTISCKSCDSDTIFSLKIEDIQTILSDTNEGLKQ